MSLPKTVEAGSAFSIQSTGSGKATLYIVGLGQVLKRDVQLGETRLSFLLDRSTMPATTWSFLPETRPQRTAHSMLCLQQACEPELSREAFSSSGRPA
jgi:hypothetical protein